MSYGRIAVFAAGAVVGGVIGYAAIKSGTVKKATRATIKAGLKAQDWAKEKCVKAKEEVKSMVASGKKEIAEEKPV